MITYNSGDNRIVGAFEADARPSRWLSRIVLTFEDFKLGHFATLGPRRVPREELLAFAAEFDPQPMHLDEAAANASMLGGLSGSGWHMCALAMRMQVDGFIGRSASMGGVGVDEVKWLAPLRPNDDLTLEVHVDESRPLKSRPEAGLVKLRAEMFNASGQRLMVLVANVLMRRRDAVSGDDAGGGT